MLMPSAKVLSRNQNWGFLLREDSYLLNQRQKVAINDKSGRQTGTVELEMKLRF